MSPEDYKKLQALVDSKSKKSSYGDRALASVVEIKIDKQAKSKKKGSKAKGEMELVIKGMFPEYKKEYEFAPGRKYRSDFFVPFGEKGILIEYEGIYVQQGEMSGHTSWSGFSKDVLKYNLATVLGYKVLRYTNTNYESMGADLWQIKYGVNE